MHLDIFREPNGKWIKKNMISQCMKKNIISQSSLFIYNDNLGIQNWRQNIDWTIVITQSFELYIGDLQELLSQKYGGFTFKFIRTLSIGSMHHLKTHNSETQMRA